MSFRNKFL